MELETIFFLAKAAKDRYFRTKEVWALRLLEATEGFEKWKETHDENDPKQHQGFSTEIKIAKHRLQEVEKWYKDAVEYLAEQSQMPVKDIYRVETYIN